MGVEWEIGAEMLENYNERTAVKAAVLSFLAV
jgi:hypothetical protein